MDISFDWILIVVRVSVGVVMVHYGWQKVRDFRANARDFRAMGFWPPAFWGTIVALLEFGGGLLLILGVYTAFIAALVAFQMLIGTLWKAFRIKKPFSDYSYDILLFALCVVLMSRGGGVLALYDRSVLTLDRWDVALGAGIAAVLLTVTARPKGKLAA